MNSVHQRAFSNGSQHSCHTIFYVLTLCIIIYLQCSPTRRTISPSLNRNFRPGSLLCVFFVGKVRNRWGCCFVFLCWNGIVALCSLCWNRCGIGEVVALYFLCWKRCGIGWVVALCFFVGKGLE